MASTLERLANESTTDRWIRGIVGVVLVVLGYVLHPGVVFAVVLYVIGAVLIVTALTGFCPLYALLGIRTNGGKEHHTHTPSHA